MKAKHTQDPHQAYLAHKAAVEKAQSDYEELKLLQAKYEEAKQAVAKSKDTLKVYTKLRADLDVAKKAYQTFLQSHKHFH